MERTFNLGDIVRVTSDMNNGVFLAYVTEIRHNLESDGKTHTLYEFTYGPMDTDSFYHKGVNDDDNAYFIGYKLGNITQNQSAEKANIIQVTCMERTEETEESFSDMLDSIQNGNHCNVISAMKTWAKSDLEPKTYTKLLELAENGEHIVYDDGEYILTASDTIVILYRREE